MADDKPIIVIKKKGGHGGHHGGAWKIAYADFVTAMMCFFMVMWLVNTASTPTKQAIASYFRKPGIFTDGSGHPISPGGQGILPDAFTPPKSADRKKIKNPVDDPAPRLSGELDKDLDKQYTHDGRMEPEPFKGPDLKSGRTWDEHAERDTRQKEDLRAIGMKAQAELLERVKAVPDAAEKLGAIEIKADQDGIKIEIMDTERVSMFNSGSSVIRPPAQAAFALIAGVLKEYPNTIDISGHTDATPFPSRSGGFSNWELSADRANAARRLLETNGYPAAQVSSVIGKAATEPKVPKNPSAPSNRRITLKVRFDPRAAAQSGAASEIVESLKRNLLPPQPPPNGTASVEPPPETTPAAAATAPPSPIPETPTPQNSPSSKYIRLPEGPPVTANPDYMPEDKIFGNIPVVKPGELYAGW